MKRTPLRRRTPLKSGSFIRRQGSKKHRFSTLNPISKKHALELEKYKIVRLEYLAEHPICQACHKRPSTQIHHRKGKLGPLLTDKRFFMATCMDDHNWIENNRDAARDRGWLLDRLGVDNGEI